MKSEIPFSLISVFSNPSIDANGNLSAVLLLNEDLSDDKLQKIATELSQPATTFLWQTNVENEYKIRWFAPDAEIGLCGHGAMAASVFLTDHFNQTKDPFLLKKDDTRIEAGKKNDLESYVTLQTIRDRTKKEPPEGLEEALGQKVVEYYHTDNKSIVLLESESHLAKMKPNFEALRKIDVFGYAVTAPSNEKDDFVCRTLVPHVQQLEDHATGSTQAVLVDYWSKKLNKTELESRQLSPRGGYFQAQIKGDRFTLIAQSSCLVKGTFFLH